MKRNQYKRLAILSTAVSAVLGGGSAGRADTFIKAANNDALNLTTSWTHGADIPGSDDIAVWNDVAGVTTNALGANLQWQGMRITNTHTGNVTFSAGNTLTLGAEGLANASTATLQFNNLISLGANQTWTKLGGGMIMTQTNSVALNGFTLTFAGAGGTHQHKTAFTGTGRINIEHGDVRWESAAKAADATLAIGLGASLSFSGAVSGARAAGLIMQGGTLTISNTANQVDTFTNGLTVTGGHSIMTIGVNGSRTTLVEAGGFKRDAGATLLVRGTNLGVNGLAPLSVNSANLKLSGTVALTGGGGTADQTTIGIVKGVFGDASSSSGNGQGLVTYDSTYGLRLLNTTTEYTSAITPQQSQLDNVRLTSTLAPVTHTLSGATTVNSLSLVQSTTSGASVTLTGGTLKIASGVVFANSISPATISGSQMTISSNLDFNGGEGVIYFNTGGQSGSIGGALLNLEGDLTNATGLVFAGSGTARIGGTSASTYTGTTTLNSGTLLLAKSGAGANAAINGDLVINGGRLLFESNEQIADTANVTVNGGVFDLRPASNSGSGRTETINNLTINGGQVTGASGSGTQFLTVNQVLITGGTLSATRPKRINITGGISFTPGSETAGGQLTIERANSNSSAFDTIVTISGGLNITSTQRDSLGSYVPIVINPGTSATNFGGRLQLNSDVTFFGNSTNSSATVIDAPAGTNLGVIVLNGNRTFNIGNGAAADDLIVVPAMLDNGATVGGLTKTGLGTLTLNGANAYTGSTNVTAGTLKVGGSLAGDNVIVGLDGTLELANATSLSNTTNLIIEESLTDHGVVNLNFVGSETVGWLVVGEDIYWTGTYDSSTNPGYFTGTGSITATPEPASLSLLAMAGVGLLSRRRRRA